MGDPSSACLHYLFATRTPAGQAPLRREVRVTVPGTDQTVPLGPLERLLLRVAFSELVEAGNLEMRLVERPGPGWLERARPAAAAGRGRPGALVLARRRSPPPRPGSLAEDLLRRMPGRPVPVATALYLWAGERWPLPLDAVVRVVRDEALACGALRPAVPEMADASRAAGELLPVFRAAFGRCEEFARRYPDETAGLEGGIDAALRGMRPTARMLGRGRPGGKSAVR